MFRSRLLSSDLLISVSQGHCDRDRNQGKHRRREPVPSVSTRLDAPTTWPKIKKHCPSPVEPARPEAHLGFDNHRVVMLPAVNLFSGHMTVRVLKRGHFLRMRACLLAAIATDHLNPDSHVLLLPRAIVQISVRRAWVLVMVAASKRDQRRLPVWCIDIAAERGLSNV
jgi:hypothetical protein